MSSPAIERISLGPVQNPVRGVVDGSGLLLALGAAALLWTQCPPLGPERWGLLAFTIGHLGLWSASLLYHAVPWTPTWKRRMQRVDHSMIYLKIAGSLTPVAILGMGERAVPLLTAAWTIAALGIAQKAWLPRVHERASIPVQALQAVLVVPALLALAERFPGTPARLAAAGACCYALGAIVFVSERPRLWPRVFSFHDLFHLLLAAGGVLYAALLLEVLARA